MCGLKLSSQLRWITGCCNIGKNICYSIRGVREVIYISLTFIEFVWCDCLCCLFYHSFLPWTNFIIASKWNILHLNKETFPLLWQNTAPGKKKKLEDLELGLFCQTTFSKVENELSCFILNADVRKVKSCIYYGEISQIWPIYMSDEKIRQQYKTKVGISTSCFHKLLTDLPVTAGDVCGILLTKPSKL